MTSFLEKPLHCQLAVIIGQILYYDLTESCYKGMKLVFIIAEKRKRDLFILK